MILNTSAAITNTELKIFSVTFYAINPFQNATYITELLNTTVQPSFTPQKQILTIYIQNNKNIILEFKTFPSSYSGHFGHISDFDAARTKEKIQAPNFH
jgi:hypothetical protein